MSESWLSPDGVAAGCTVVALAGGALISWLGSVDRVQAKEIERLDKNLGAAFEKLDRLNEAKSAYMTRSDHDSLRREIKTDIDSLGSRMKEDLAGAVSLLTTLISKLREDSKQ